MCSLSMHGGELFDDIVIEFWIIEFYEVPTFKVSGVCLLHMNVNKAQELSTRIF